MWDYYNDKTLLLTHFEDMINELHRLEHHRQADEFNKLYIALRDILKNDKLI